MIAFPKFKKTIGLFTSKFQKQFLSQKHANHAQLEALSRDKNINFNLKNNFHFAIKNITTVSTCHRRLTMLKEFKPQSKSPTPSFYQHFKTPSNKYNPQSPRYRSRSIHYR